MNRSPAFQFYPDKWVAETSHLSAEAYRAYHKCLCWMWLQGPHEDSMPDTPEAWRIVTGLSGKALDRVRREMLNPAQPLLRLLGERLVHEGLRREIAKQNAFRRQKRQAAKSRWSKPKAAMQEQCARTGPALRAADSPQCSPSVSSSVSPSASPGEREARAREGGADRTTALAPGGGPRAESLAEKYRLKAEDTGPRGVLVGKMAEYLEFFTEAQIAQGIERWAKPGMRLHEFYRALQRARQMRPRPAPRPEIPREEAERFEALWRAAESGELKQLTFKRDGRSVRITQTPPGAIYWIDDEGKSNGLITPSCVDAVEGVERA